MTEKEIAVYKRKSIVLFRITNSSGAYIEVINYGAIVVSVVVPDKDGKLDNVVLRYDDPTDYFTDPFYLGATIGRVANRIANAEFRLDGKTYRLDKNDGANSNHGGFGGFDKKVYDYQIKGDSLVLSARSVDGEGGFPANLEFEVEYSFSDDNELRIAYTACADGRTPVNLTNHAYFDLSGQGDTILHDKLRVNAEQYLESNNQFLPTGKVCAVEGTAFDFREYLEIAQMMPLKKDNLKGYNAFFVKDANHPDDQPLASLLNTASGRTVDLYTSMPGVLVYTGDYLSDKFKPFGGICLEAQYPPDGVNQPHFEQNILEANEPKTDTIVYRFGCVNV